MSNRIQKKKNGLDLDTFIIITLVALLAATGMAWLTRILRKDETESDLPADIFDSKLGWEDYLLLIREHYVGQGFALRENPTGGADFEIERGGQRQLVDFVDLPDGAVGEQAIREFHQIVAKRNADGGILIAAGRFTPQAKTLADERSIDLIDGARLQRLVEAAREESGELTAPRQPGDDDTTTPRRVLLCPLCGRTMVKRYERIDGESRPYFGCVRAPACKGRRDFA